MIHAAEVSAAGHVDELNGCDLFLFVLRWDGQRDLSDLTWQLLENT